MIFSLAQRIEDIRAKVYFNSDSGSAFETPFVQSFNVSRQRGSAVATANVTLRIESSRIKDILTVSTSPSLGDNWNDVNSIVIQAQEKNTSTGWVTIFTGIIKSVNFRADFLHPNYYNVDLQANDIFDVLQNRTFTRRVKTDGMGVFGVITGLTRKASFGRNRSVNSSMGRFGGRGASGVSSENSGSGFGGSSLKKGGFKKSAEGAGPTQEYLSDSLSPSSHVKAPVKISSNSWWFDRGYFKSDGALGGEAAEPGVNATLVITPSVVIMLPGETQTFKCLSSDICAPGGAASYTWSVSDPTIGQFVVGGVDRSEDNASDPANIPITYRHDVAGKVTNQIILKDNENNLTGIATVLGFTIHKHADITEGGPAYGTYAPTTDEEE